KSYLSKRSLIILLVLIVATPLFAYAAEIVGYSEPLENLAEEFGAEENPLYHGLFPDYTIPGVDPYIGTIISAVVGTLVTIILIVLILKAMLRGKTNGPNT
ncbi:MAG: PDGLE domain-containing protein, partial [Crenarchaeota archaeon]|nr:PDGLE domain-containing protein [Thermoproteota archaeon]